ncbi:MAG TPA: HEAT repeat domain-containing protein [Gemmatimonadaceae bacterium]|nr:HEAT repeat domain-containing protein [Gemmatimonadaceae bacterium]
MKYITLGLMVLVAAVPMTVTAQVPPVPPEKSARPPLPAKPLPPTDELYPPRPVKAFVKPMEFEFERLGDELEFRAKELKIQALDLANLDIERLNSKIEKLSYDFGDLTKLDAKELAVSAKALADEAKFLAPKIAKADWGDRWIETPVVSKLEFGSDKLLSARPRQAWASGDPADSLYRAAREALNRGEYRRAAQLFGEVQKRFPKSEYVLDCTYWEAFSRYRAGSTEDLRQALRILEEGRVQLASLRSDGNVDVQALRTRVQGALAARGDDGAAEKLKRELSQSGEASCDPEDIAVRAEALGALGQMDRASAMPSVKKILLRRDECYAPLRRRALYVAARDADAEAVTLILDVAKNDPDANIRGEAMRLLPRVAGDNAVPQLEELLRTSPDEQTQRYAISALASIDSDRARRAVRAIIERNDASERVRYEAIMSISRERDGRPASADDANYLRTLYGKLDAPRLREAVLTSASRFDTPENVQFLLAVARNENEMTALRATAVQRLGRMSSVNLNDIAKLYDVADSRSMREQILNALYQRKEPEAVDRMIEIARKDTDPQIRQRAINLLARSENPKAKKWLQELLDK